MAYLRSAEYCLLLVKIITDLVMTRRQISRTQTGHSVADEANILFVKRFKLFTHTMPYSNISTDHITTTTTTTTTITTTTEEETMFVCSLNRRQMI